MNSEEEPPNKKAKTSESVSQLYLNCIYSFRGIINEGLSKYISTISSTLSSSFKQMSDNATNNLKAIQTMSSMLEKTMIQSYKCSIFALF